MIEIKSVDEFLNHIDGLKAVILDLDDTLYGEKEYVKSGYRAVAKHLKDIDGAEEKLWDAFQNKKNAIDYVLQQAGIYTEELKAECLNIYREHKPEIHLYPGIPEIIETLKQRNIKIGIITEGRPEGQHAKLKALHLEEFSEFTIITDELGGIQFRKPNPTAFILMRERMNVEFSEMCYIADNITKDFIAPEKLGMRAIWFQNEDGLYYTKS